MIKVKCEIPIVESSASDFKGDEVVVMKHHWNDPKRVVLVAGDVHYVVKKIDIISAVENCTNTARFG